MKWFIYSVAVLFLVGGAVCSSANPAVEPNAADSKTEPKTEPTKLDDKKPETVSYSKDVRPFLATYCLECHTGKNAKAGFNFEDYDALLKGSRKGKAVVEGDPDKSAIIRTLAGKGKKMPPPKYKNQPTADEVDMLKAWITAGAKNDSDKDK